MINDQRSNPRVSLFISGTLYRGPSGEKPGRIVIRDLSAAGIRIESLYTLNKDQILYLDFEIAGRFSFVKVPVKVSRIYRHTGSYLSGLKFMKDEDHVRIQEALVYLIENPLNPPK